MQTQQTPEQLKTTIVSLLDDLKAQDIQVFPMNHYSALAEFIVICHGTSNAHLNGIKEHVYLSLKNDAKLLPLGIEGEKEQEWILMDYNSVIIHLFLEEKREYYKLETFLSKSKEQE